MNKNKYFYHGFDFNIGFESIDFLYKFLLSGKIKSRVGRVCLYQKNDDYDYSNMENYMKSARSGWIDNCVVFVIRPDIAAYKFEYDDSLVDEWRTNDDIDFSDVVGICFPRGFFECSSEFESPLNIEKAKNLHEKIDEIIASYGWFVGCSSDENFTDRLDESLNKEDINNCNR